MKTIEDAHLVEVMYINCLEDVKRQLKNSVLLKKAI